MFGYRRLRLVFCHFVVFGKDATDLVDGMAGEGGRGFFRGLSYFFFSSPRFFADYMRQRMGLWGTFAVYMVMTVALALVLARLVERPMIRLGKKLSFKK